MSQQAEQQAGWTGVYLSPMAQRRTAFEQSCGTLFARLELADSPQQAANLLAAGADLLVIDLERFEPSIDLAVLGKLLARREGRAALLLCPFANARWITMLGAFGAAGYAITPSEPQALREAVADRLARLPEVAVQADPGRLRACLSLRARVQAALEGNDDEQNLAERLCAALAAWPGVVHCAMFERLADGDLVLSAESGQAAGLRVPALLGGASGLLQAPLRHAFPGLLAAATGELVLQDALEQSGEPGLAGALREHGVAMAVGVPVPAEGPGAPRGALSLLFGAPREFAPEELAALQDCARLAALGLRLADMTRESEQMLVRLTYVSTTDALTGVANRRHGEELIEREVKRARRYRAPLALLGFDIDRFRAINDTYGHPVGDVALRAVADCVRAVLRSSDVLVRSGGEEFTVIAPHTSAIDGLKMAEKIRLAVEQALIPGVDHVTVSLGVAQLGEQESSDSLVQRVEAALARAKRAGRNCVELAMQ